MVIKQVAQHVSESDITAATEAATNLSGNGSIPHPLLDSVDPMDAGLIEGALVLWQAE